MPGWDSETADGCVDAYQAVYIALWMRDYRLLPDEKLTFSNELTSFEMTYEELVYSDKFIPLYNFLFLSNLYSGKPIELTNQTQEKYIMALESGDMTACELLDEFYSKSSLTFERPYEYVSFIYLLFLHREPTSEEELAGHYLLLEADGRSALTDQLLHSDEFIQLCENSYVTVGDGLTEFN